MRHRNRWLAVFITSSVMVAAAMPTAAGSAIGPNQPAQAAEGGPALSKAGATPVIVVHGIGGNVCDYAGGDDFNQTVLDLGDADRWLAAADRNAIYDRYIDYVGDPRLVPPCVRDSPFGVLYHTYPDDRGLGDDEMFRSAPSADENADYLAALVLAAAEASPTGQVDLVAYSLGGLTLRTMLAKYGAIRPAVGRIVFANTVHEGAWTASLALLYRELLREGVTFDRVSEALSGCANYLEANELLATGDASLACQIFTAIVVTAIELDIGTVLDPLRAEVDREAVVSLAPRSSEIVMNAASSLEGVDVLVIGSDQRIRRKPGFSLLGWRVNTPTGKAHRWTGDHVIQAGIEPARVAAFGSMLMNPATAMSARSYQEWIFYDECAVEISTLDGLIIAGKAVTNDLLTAAAQLALPIDDTVITEVVDQAEGFVRGVELTRDAVQSLGADLIGELTTAVDYLSCATQSGYFHRDVPIVDEIERPAAKGREILNLGNGKIEGTINRSVRGLDEDQYETLDALQARLDPTNWSIADLVVSFIGSDDSTRPPGLDDPRQTFIRSGLSSSLGASERFVIDYLDIEPEATEPPAVLVLLDTSGSMSESDGNGVRKIDGARAAAEAYVDGIGRNTASGLRIYGGGQCAGGTLLLDIAAGNGDQIRNRMSTITPDGDTDTGPALRAAAADLSGRRAPTVMLVSDGLSNCGEPPCPVAEDLAAAGIGLTVNTVGFQIDAAGRAELECIAAATNGVYSDVQDSDALIEEFLALQRSELVLRLNATSAVAATDEGYQPLEIRATLENMGPGIAENVTVTLTGDREIVGSPRRQSFGELGVGADVEMLFAEPIERQYDPKLFGYEITADASNSQAVSFEGSIEVPATWVGVNDAGPILRDAQRPLVMGDSYSSGEGAGSYDPGTDGPDNRCHRSDLTFAAQLYPDVINAACSGAKISALYYPNQNEPPQLDRIPGDADLLLVSLGGNDVNFHTIIVRCLTSANCSSDASTLANIVCRFDGGCVESDLTGEEFVQQQLATLPSSLEWAYTNALREAPGATLVVVPYPRIVPTRWNDDLTCPARLNRTEIEWIVTIIDRLNLAAQLAVAAARDQGYSIRYAADVETAFDGHTLCDPAPWVNNLLVSALQQSFHPDRYGYLAIAEAIKSSSFDWEPATFVARQPDTPSPIAVVEAGSPYPLQSETTESLELGAAYMFALEGVSPGNRADLYLASDPTLIGSAVADREGRVEIPAVIRSVEAGRHELIVFSVDSEGRLAQWRETVTIVEPSHSYRGWLLVGGAAILVLLVLVVGLLLWRRRHRRPMQSKWRSPSSQEAGDGE